jgi:hypothetical protein
MELHPSTEIIDSSKLTDYLTCPRQYFYRNILGWRHQGPQHDLVFGEAIHAGLEVLYLHGFGRPFGPEHTKIVVQLAFDAFLQVYRGTFSEETDEDYGAKSPFMAYEALEGYCNQYEREFERYKVYEAPDGKCIEVSGFVPIDGRERLYFRQDVILEDLSNGRKFTLEHKTAKTGGPIWAAQWDLSVQVGTYTHALYSIFPEDEVWGVRVNGILFQKKGIGYERIPCEKTLSQMQIWLETIRTTVDLLRCDMIEVCGEYIADYEVMSSFILNPTNCTKWFRVCPYHDLCLSWKNPLHHLDEIPLGMIVDFWDPANRTKIKESADE